MARKPKVRLWDLWLNHDGAGWWLEEEGYDNLQDACGSLVEKVGKGNVIGGSIVRHGEGDSVSKESERHRKWVGAKV